MPRRLLMGNQACAHAALEAGVRVVAGYPGTPSSELIETVARCVAEGSAQGVHVEWSTNEKAALELCAGASYAGARTLFTCKQVGLNVASDALMSLAYVGVQGGCVLYVADDPGPISSQTEQDTRRFASFAKVPVLDPSTVEQAMDMMREAFELSERYRTPVIVRPTTRVCHSSAFVEIAEATVAREAAGFAKDDSRWVIFPARATRGHAEILDRLAAIEGEFSGHPEALVGPRTGAQLPFVGEPRDLSGLCERRRPEGATRGIIAGGASAAFALEALELLGEPAAQAAFLQVGAVYPFPRTLAGEFLDGLDEVLVLEELDSVIEEELLKLAGERAQRGLASPRIRGRLTGDAREVGENSARELADRIGAFLGIEPPREQGEAEAPSFDASTLPARPPVLCPGCPHRGSFFAAKRALKRLRKKGVFSGDIGCYTLGNAQPLDAVDTCLCMGAGITMAQGIGVVDGAKQLAFIGDSTFFASGMTGVANAVYNRHDITICVLDNSTTAMTGGQPHPGTGVDLMGGQAEGQSIEAVLEALGVSCIAFADPLDLEASISAYEQALSYEGPSAVILRSPCIDLIPMGAPYRVDAEGCTGCKRCITTIGCPAIGFDGGCALIDETLCNGCGLCAQVCPFAVIRGADEGGRS